MADFGRAFRYTMQFEGGYSNHPSDKGGPTNMGITQQTLSEWRRVPVTEQDVKELTEREAMMIYRWRYWFFDTVMSQRVATKLFDMGVNVGPARAIKMAQNALVGSFGAPIDIDGQCGPKTCAALNLVPEKELLEALVMRAEKYYHQIVARDESQAVFLRGWLRRARSLPMEGL